MWDRFGGEFKGIFGVHAFGNPDTEGYKQGEGLGTVAGVVLPFGKIGTASKAAKTLKANQKVGTAAEARIARTHPGSRRQVTFTAASGTRRVDVLTSYGHAIESKVGRTSLTADVERQIQKDLELLANPSTRVVSLEWRFATSPRTGQIGPTGPLERRLKNAGILITYDP
jgi:hypothetical protein